MLVVGPYESWNKYTSSLRGSTGKLLGHNDLILL